MESKKSRYDRYIKFIEERDNFNSQRDILNLLFLVKDIVQNQRLNVSQNTTQIPNRPPLSQTDKRNDNKNDVEEHSVQPSEDQKEDSKLDEEIKEKVEYERVHENSKNGVIIQKSKCTF